MMVISDPQPSIFPISTWSSLWAALRSPLLGGGASVDSAGATISGPARWLSAERPIGTGGGPLADREAGPAALRGGGLGQGEGRGGVT
jgi:hypothetical protein